MANIILNIEDCSTENPCLTSLMDGLIAYYKLNDTTGDVIDEFGLHHLTNHGATRGEVGKLGNSFKFNAISETYCIGDSPMYGLTQGTISCWMKFEIPTALQYAIAGEYGSYNILSPSVGVALKDGINYKPLVGGWLDGLYNNINTIDTWDANTWLLVTNRFHIDESGYLNYKISINIEHGIEYMLSGSVFIALSNKLTFGAALDGIWINYGYNGWLDDIKIWDREITDCEIAANYNDGVGVELTII